MTCDGPRRLLGAIALGFLLGGCQEAARVRPGESDSPSLDEARSTIAELKRIEYQAPPRRVDDVLDQLDRHEETRAGELEALLAQASAPLRDDASAHARVLALYGRALAARTLGHGAAELADLRVAVAIVDGWSASDGRPPGDDFLQSLVRDAAWAESAEGDLRAALDLFRRASTYRGMHASAAGKGHWRASWGLALVSARTGDIVGARAAARDALVTAEGLETYEPVERGYDRRELENWLSILMRDQRDPWKRVYAQSVEAAILEAEGRWQDAEVHAREAIRVYEDDLDGGRTGVFSHGREAGWTQVQHAALARNLAQQGRLTEAEVIVRTGLSEVLPVTGTRSKIVGALLARLTDLLLAEGRFAEAEQLAARTEAIYRSLGAPADSALLAEARLQRAQSLAMRDRWVEAGSVYRETEGAFAANRTTFERRFALDPASLIVVIKAGDAVAAQARLERARARSAANKGANHYDTLELVALAALARKVAGDAAGAQALYAQSVDGLIEADRRSRGAQGLRRDRRRRLEIVLEGYLDLTLGRVADPDEAAVRKGFAVAAHLQAGPVQVAVARSAARAAEGAGLSDLLRAADDAALQLEAAHDLLARALATGGAGTPLAPSLRARIDALARSKRVVEAEIAARHPGYETLVNPPPPDLPRLRARLDPDEAMLAYYATDVFTYVWALRREGPVGFSATDLGRTALAERVGRLREALDADIETIGDIPDFDVAAARALHARIVEPVAPALAGASSLVVVPHGSLGYLPFALLVRVPTRVGADRHLLFDRYRQVPWMARAYAISRVPSVSAFEALRASRGAREHAEPLVAFADPLFGAVDAAAALATRAASPASMRRALDTRAAPSATIESLPPLPETADEVLAIAEALGADRRGSVFLRAAATESAVLAAPLDRARVVVFATHGLAAGDLDGLTQPALALTSPALGDGIGDGLLTMDEVLGLRVDADWVVLSACNTAAGDGATAEAVSGLGRAFFHAGSRALLVSNWPVHSLATTRLTEGIFRRRAAGVADRAEALRASMESLIDDGTHPGGPGGGALFSYAHPIFWAPFTLVGDGGT